MKLIQATLCNQCNGVGEVRTMDKVYGDDIIEAPVGSEVCENCNGSGIEPNEEIIVERIVENTTKEQEEKLQKVFMELKEVENYENWVGRLSLKELIKILYD